MRGGVANAMRASGLFMKTTNQRVENYFDRPELQTQANIQCIFLFIETNREHYGQQGISLWTRTKTKIFYFIGHYKQRVIIVTPHFLSHY